MRKSAVFCEKHIGLHVQMKQLLSSTEDLIKWFDVSWIGSQVSESHSWSSYALKGRNVFASSSNIHFNTISMQTEWQILPVDSSSSEMYLFLLFSSLKKITSINSNPPRCINWWWAILCFSNTTHGSFSLQYCLFVCYVGVYMYVNRNP